MCAPLVNYLTVNSKKPDLTVKLNVEKLLNVGYERKEQCILATV